MKVGESFEERDSDDPLPPEPSEEERAALDEPLARPMAAFSDVEIMRELELRYPAFVFYGQMRKEDDLSHSYIHTKGLYPHVVGLAQCLMWRLRDDF